MGITLEELQEELAGLTRGLATLDAREAKALRLAEQLREARIAQQAAIQHTQQLIAKIEAKAEQAEKRARAAAQGIRPQTDGQTDMSTEAATPAPEEPTLP